jgi:hypothetical protein
MWNLRRLIGITGMACAFNGLVADVLRPIRDTSIAEEAPNATHYDASDTLFTIGVPGFRAYGFVKFDLTQYAGQHLVGAATFGAYLAGQYPENSGSRTASVWALTQDWPSAGLTWNSFGASPGVTFGVETEATPEDAFSVNLTNEGVGYREFSISASLVQTWIDHPGANYGLLLAVTSPSAEPLYWRSADGPQGTAPYLQIEPVPEASTLVPASIVVLLAGGFAVRRASRASLGSELETAAGNFVA